MVDIELYCAMTQCQELSGCQFILSRHRVLSVWLLRSVDALGSLSNRELSQTTFTHLACSCLIVFSLKSLSANFLIAARLSLLSYGLVLSVWDFWWVTPWAEREAIAKTKSKWKIVDNWKVFADSFSVLLAFGSEASYVCSVNNHLPNFPVSEKRFNTCQENSYLLLL